MGRTRALHGVDAALNVIGGKWKAPILRALQDGGLHYGELRRHVGGISETMLSRQLKELETARVVHRDSHDTVPPRVEYSLTELGVSLLKALTPLHDWGVDHVVRTEESAPDRPPPNGSRTR